MYGNLVEIKGNYIYPEIGGIDYGSKIVLVRLGGCNLTCGFCDHISTWKREMVKNYKIIDWITDKVIEKGNPIDSGEIIEIIDKFRTLDLHAIYFTGGEPTFQIDFLEAILKGLKEKNYRTFIQTNGSMPDRIKRIVDLLDYVSVDIKDRSARSCPDWEMLVKRELKSLRYSIDAGIRTDAKIIVTPKTSYEDLKMIGYRLSKIDVYRVIWQPNLPYGRFKTSITPEQFLEIPKTLVESGIEPRKLYMSRSAELIGNPLKQKTEGG